jgi:hypothetical protein
MDGTSAGARSDHEAAMASSILRIILNDLPLKEHLPNLLRGDHWVSPRHLADCVRQEENPPPGRLSYFVQEVRLHFGRLAYRKTGLCPTMETGAAPFTENSPEAGSASEALGPRPRQTARAARAPTGPLFFARRSGFAPRAMLCAAQYQAGKTRRPLRNSERGKRLTTHSIPPQPLL